MAKMKKLTPRLKALKDTYGDDRAKLHQAMAEMYKTEKINPLGGCLPILIQIPVFIALYWCCWRGGNARRAVAGLGHRPDSARSLVHPAGRHGHHLDPAGQAQPAADGSDAGQDHDDHADCVHRDVVFFPAGLVLYWVVNNILSIASSGRSTSRSRAVANPPPARPDLIAAIATAPGRGGVGCAGVGGGHRPACDCDPRARSRTAPCTFSNFLDRDGQSIDEGIALVFAAPHSFTGEHVLELQGTAARW